MSLKALRTASEKLDTEGIFNLSADEKICRVKGVLIAAATIIRSVIPPIWWGIIARASLEIAISALNEKCPDTENPATESPS